MRQKINKSYTEFKKLSRRFLEDDVRLIFLVYLALPLLYIPNFPFASRSLRIIFVILLAFIALLVKTMRQEMTRNFTQLPRVARWTLLFMAALILLSSLLSALPINVVLLGRNPDLMGLFAWLSLVPFGLIIARRLPDLLFSRVSFLVMTAIIVVSLIAGYEAIMTGYRVPGLMMQATTMAIYSSLTALVALQVGTQETGRWKAMSWLGLVLAVFCTVVTLSRIGYMALIFVLIAYALYYAKISKITSINLMLIVGIVALVPSLSVEHFSRFSSTKLSEGVTYRRGIYQTTMNEVWRENIFLGKGPNALPKGLNNTDYVPEDIAKTLNDGYHFISSHDLFIDLALYFGLTAAILFFYICMYSGWIALTKFHNHWPLFVMLVVLLLNALVNVFSPELTSFVIVIMMALMVLRPSKVS